MRLIGLGLALMTILSSQASLANEEPTVLELSQIQGVMEELNCRLKPEMVKKLDDGFIVKDVFCADGSYEVRLDADFKILSKVAE